MADSSIVSNLVNAGSAGLVIIVVILFLRYLGTERVRANEQHLGMMNFIREQRESNNEANIEASKVIADAQIRAADQSSGTYIQVADAVKSMAVEIRLIRESHIEHDTRMNTALDDMRKARAASSRKKGVST